MQTATRNFDPTSTPGLSAEARKAVNAALTRCLLGALKQ
jgi:hypothetical protein